MAQEEKQTVDFVRYVIESICENKEQISIEAKEDELGTLILIQVAEEDMGKLIGKQGNTIASIRTLVRVIGARERKRINIKVIE